MTDKKSLFDAPEVEDGWTPLELYAYIVRNLGIPAVFRLDADEWVAEGPYAKPSRRLLDLLESHDV